VAHRAALEAGGRTLAVLANGLAQTYPPEHADLARQVEAAGALLMLEMRKAARRLPGNRYERC
jgi:DNA processing protein